MSANWLDRLEAVLLVVLSGFLFWPMGISSSCLIALLLLHIVRKGKDILPPLKRWWFITPALVAILSWVAWRLPEDGLREVRLWPILIVAFPVFYRNPLHGYFLLGFRWLSILQVAIILVFLALHPPFESASFSYELRESIAAVFHVHPTYLSAAWFFAAFLFLGDQDFPKLLKWGSITLLFAGASLCGGKMPLIAFLLISALWFLKEWKQPMLKATALISLAAVSVLVVIFNPAMRQRFDELTSIRTDFEEGDLLSSTDLRIGIWNCSLKLIGEHPLAGVGTGNTRSSLEDCFSSYEQVEFFDGEYNTHNQFLHFGLLFGIPGMMLFLAVLFGFLVQGIRTGNNLLLYTTLFFLLLFLTENYLGRQLGMMFFSFFAALAFGLGGKQPTSARPFGSR